MKIFLFWVVTIALFVPFAKIAVADEKLRTKVVTEDQTHITQYDGSYFKTYFYGRTATSINTIAGIAVIEPNNEIHPPHKHKEDEFLMIIEGNGEWFINGEKFEAKPGDMLYAAPDDIHGLFNSGDTPLKFVIFKWQQKKVESQ